MLIGGNARLVVNCRGGQVTGRDIGCWIGMYGVLCMFVLYAEALYAYVALCSSGVMLSE